MVKSTLPSFEFVKKGDPKLGRSFSLSIKFSLQVLCISVPSNVLVSVPEATYPYVTESTYSLHYRWSPSSPQGRRLPRLRSEKATHQEMQSIKFHQCTLKIFTLFCNN